jgi:acetyl-CoA acyltransferase
MNRTLQDAYIVAAARTPIGKSHRGCFRHTRPDDLLAHAIRAALGQVPGFDVGLIEDAIVGCAVPEAQQGLNLARLAVLRAGLPHRVGGITVNRFCASGLSAIAMAADRIRVGEADAVLAGGVESMSLVPMMGHNPSFNPVFLQSNEAIGIAYGMGLTAEKVAQQWHVSRADQDAFALQSHQRALAAQASGEPLGIAPFDVEVRSADLVRGEIRIETQRVERDEGPRADTSLEALAKLRSPFAANGSVTAGNSSQTSDGAGALLLVSAAMLERFKLKPLARLASFAVRGVAPEIMGIGPKEAVPIALRAAGIQQHELDRIELNEAFAAQALAVMRELDFDAQRVNPVGGAIALGHPLGATGAMRATQLLAGMQHHQERWGMVTMCVGSGMGAAAVFERCF